MTKLLIALSEGHTRSPESAEFRLRSMRDTTTFHDLLKAAHLPTQTIHLRGRLRNHDAIRWEA